ncbi:ABC transporter substrate-binding protein [Cohnella faecalis]|uniref:Helix-turn-helix domain-containing protein n=1 Tax=Cohnella faecalis TaxID=2315694 RepID=A0A398CLV2_9BACL|nr:AraC family transcriptional regulator [Cohnella faecalis]RIE03222.1 helix-turn-helix domain-containing protein [Cohnella faecalis]
MKLHEHIMIWNHVFIKVVDVRHTAMDKGEELRDYRLPGSGFLYAVRGNARIWMDCKPHRVDRFHLFHGGKGTSLTILADDVLEYYLILYKAILALPGRQELVKLMEEDNLFRYQYAFVPIYPLSLFDSVERLDKEWRKSAMLDHLQVKAIFFQFVHELLWQLRRQDIEPFKPDLVELATRYIHEHYDEPLTLDALAKALECSAGHLSRLFKSKIQSSPIHYLGQVRADRTVQLLMRTDATLQEIAERVGFPDAHSLSRSFKKYKGTSPGRYRKKNSMDRQDRDLPEFMQGIAVLQNKARPYNDIENHYQQITGRELFMQKRTKIAAMTVAMCVTLLLSACSGAANTNRNAQAEASQPTGTQSEQASKAPQAETPKQTRIVSTPKGDVEVPTEPKRVVADQYMGHLLKLGIVPIGVRTFMLTEGWMDKAGIEKETLAKIEDMGGFPMNLEKMVSMEPDLIIGSVEENYEQYDKVGTTVFLPYWEGKSTAGPLDKFRKVSDIFGKRQEAEKWIAEYEQKVTEAQEKLKGVIKDGETVSVVQFSEKAIYVLAAKGGNYGSATIYQMLKLPPTDAAANMEEGFKSISMEILPDYLGDYIFVYNGDVEATRKAMESDLWKGIPSVKKNHVYLYGNSFHDEFVMEDPYSLELQLDTIVNLLLGK